MSFRLLLAVCSFTLLGACAHGGKHHHGHKHKKDHHKEMWKKMDADGDGAVTRKEFDKMHGDMFAKMDANKDGKVTKEEKMAFHKSKMKKKCKDHKDSKEKEGCCG